MTAKLAAALAAFQAEMPTVPKSHTAKVPTKSGGNYSYTYADLADVTEAAMPILAKHGLAFSTCPQATERGGYELRGILLHNSGETVEGTLPIAGNSPQEMGSSLTYMRRYLLGCMTGLVTDDDDDGSLAQQSKAPKQPARKRQAAPAKPAETGEAMSDKTRAQMFALLNERGITEKDTQIAGISAVIGRQIDSRSELTEAEAQQVIQSLRGGQ
jgi:hypothetical protein